MYCKIQSTFRQIDIDAHVNVHGPYYVVRVTLFWVVVRLPL